MQTDQRNRNYLTERSIEPVYQYGSKTAMTKLITELVLLNHARQMNSNRVSGLDYNFWGFNYIGQNGPTKKN